MKTATILALLALVAVQSHAQSQSAYLRWVASASAATNPSLTYNVYRASTCAGSFSKISSAPVATTTYLDNEPGPGSYCYQVTAVLGGVESSPSNTATVTLLPLQQSPQGSQTSQSPPAFARQGCSHAGDLITWIRCVAARPRSNATSAPPAP